ncbi:MAG: flagellar motor protein MotA [Myxococcales bacterium]|nr:flagellar motor protein MotA [Myxococcales bacterium]
MSESTGGLIKTLLSLPIFHAEWVLWLLIILSFTSIGVMFERFFFYRKMRVDVDELRLKLSTQLGEQNYSAAAEDLAKIDSIETNVTLFGLRAYEKGADSVQDLLGAALRKEKARYEKRLNFLATLASNAPYIGLFGTVLGVIKAFKDLSSSMNEASASVMGGIAEALIATAVGLLVAIPAVIAFNVFRGKVKDFTDNAQLLAATLLAHLKAVELASIDEE